VAQGLISAELNSAKQMPDTAQLNSMTCQGPTGQKIQHGHNTAAWHSTSQASEPSTAQHSTAQHSTAQHSTAQHSAAQRSAPQRTTAQRSTAQHGTA